MRPLALLVAAILITSASVAAQTPSVVNGTLETHAVAGSLDRELDALVKRAADPVWVGYAVTVPARGRTAAAGRSDGPYATRRSGR